MNEGNSDNELLTIKDTASILNVSEISVKRYISQDVLESVKIAGTRRILKSSIESLPRKKTSNKVARGQHFYWSQKDANVAKRLYEKYCKPGSIIMDPFLGAGSSLYGTRGLPYKFIGVEINEHPVKIAEFNSRTLTTTTYRQLIETLETLRSKYGGFYEYELADGQKVELHKAVINRDGPIQATHVLCRAQDGQVIDSKDHPELLKQYDQRNREYSKKNIKLIDPELVKNSRIAIKENMVLSDIFSPVNFFVLGKIRNDVKHNEDFKFVLGSVLHLCKLTDKKSQSQFPYWIPKKDALDRNVFQAIEKKINQLKTQINLTPIPRYEHFTELSNAKSGCLLINRALQKITTREVPDQSVDFVLTDPPYYDQVAYSEYLKIWEHFLGYRANFEDEIIVSQRHRDTSDEKKYEIEIAKAFAVINRKMKPSATMVVYFKESRLKKVESFLRIVRRTGFNLIGHEYISAKTYTYKQNMSADTAVGGDSIYIFQKAASKNTEPIKTLIADEALLTRLITAYAYKRKSFSLNDVIHEALLKELYSRDMLAQIDNSRKIVDILNSICSYDKKTRSYKLKNFDIRNKVFYSDALEFLRALPDESVDACITDPPYNISGYDGKKNIGWLNSNTYWTDSKKFQKIDAQWDRFSDDDYLEFSQKWLTEVKRIVKPNGNIAIFGSYHNIYKIGYLLEKLDLKLINSMVWYKRNAFPNITQRMFCESTEQVVWAVNGSKKEAKNWTFNYATLKDMNGGKQMRNMFDIPITRSSEKIFGKHPSQKPLQLLEILAIGLTETGDLILDPFAGAGTTGVAAQQNNRDYLLVDNELEYIDISERRIANSPQKLKV